jgi:hypothetical protein
VRQRTVLVAVGVARRGLGHSTIQNTGRIEQSNSGVTDDLPGTGYVEEGLGLPVGVVEDPLGDLPAFHLVAVQDLTWLTDRGLVGT